MWYIGQRIVAKVSHSNGKGFKKGDEFTIRGIQKHCCSNGLMLLIDFRRTSYCHQCGFTPKGPWFHEEHFEPLQSFGEEVTERILQQMEVEV